MKYSDKTLCDGTRLGIMIYILPTYIIINTL